MNADRIRDLELIARGLVRTLNRAYESAIVTVKPDGKLCVAEGGRRVPFTDFTLDGDLPESARERLENWERNNHRHPPGSH